MRKIFILVFVLFLHSIAYGLSVQVSYPKVCTNYNTITAYGKVETNQNVAIVAPISGIININSSFKNVKKGQLIAQIYPYGLSNQLQNAKANVEAARKNLQDTIKLYQKRIATSQELEKAKILYYQSKNHLETLQVALEQSKVYAPFSGNLKYLKNGKGYISKNEPIAILTGNDNLWIKAYIEPENIERLKIGQVIYYYIDNLKHKGKIVQISHNADESGLVPIFINVNNKHLISGQWVSLSIPIYKKSAFCIPKSAIVSKGSKTYVYNIINGVVYEKQIKLINISGSTAYVEGIDKNLPIAISAVERLKNKIQVKVVK